MLSIILLTTLLGISSDTITPWLARQPFPVVASIRRVDDLQEIFQYRGDQWISPASTWKIVAVATAQQRLGSSFRFQTPVTYSGTIQENNLWGDIIVEGTGDPTLGSARFSGVDPIRKLVNSLKSLGIRRIEGQIRLKNSTSTPSIPDSWVYGDIGNYYGAAPHVFNYQENQFSIYFSGGKWIGDPAKIERITPKDPQWIIQNEVKTGSPASGDQVMIYSAPGGSTLNLQGTVPLKSQQFAVKGSIHHPWRLFTLALRTALAEAGIQWVEAETANNSPETFLLFWESPTVEEIGKRCLAESINLYADALIRRAASTDVRIPWKDIKLPVVATWANFPTPFWEDGSGLSPMNLLQASQFSLFLAKIPQPKQWALWLPELGKEGTVRSFQPANMPIYVKSGSIQYVRTYAGYFQGRDGSWYTFFVGAHPIRPDQTKIVRQFFQSFFKKLPDSVSCPGSC